NSMEESHLFLAQLRWNTTFFNGSVPADGTHSSGGGQNRHRSQLYRRLSAPVLNHRSRNTIETSHFPRDGNPGGNDSRAGIVSWRNPYLRRVATRSRERKRTADSCRTARSVPRQTSFPRERNIRHHREPCQPFAIADDAQ